MAVCDQRFSNEVGKKRVMTVQVSCLLGLSVFGAGRTFALWPGCKMGT